MKNFYVLILWILLPWIAFGTTGPCEKVFDNQDMEVLQILSYDPYLRSKIDDILRSKGINVTKYYGSKKPKPILDLSLDEVISTLKADPESKFRMDLRLFEMFLVLRLPDEYLPDSLSFAKKEVSDTAVRSQRANLDIKASPKEGHLLPAVVEYNWDIGVFSLAWF